jgi:hypothetical protein|tara:strand:+ start:586 stop:930 length:345 start_codon:yes stop_codon:yes gene_type:complete
MIDTSAFMVGRLSPWPSKEELADLLNSNGLDISIGKYSIRIKNFSHFVFQQYGGDLGEPDIDADAESAAEMIDSAEIVSRILANANIKHRFEIYDHKDALACYLHHSWPQQNDI